MFRLGFKMKGGLAEGGAPRTHNIFGRSLVGHWHCGRKHVQGRSHEGTVLYEV